jgi:hypothetical protein
MQIADLHTHTNCSDGVLSPIQLIDKIKEKGISILSITDHDTLQAYTNDTIEYAKSMSIELIAGIELSTSFGKGEFHLLGYGFDLNNQAMIDYCIKLNKIRENRGKTIVEKLQKIGKDISFEEVKEISKNGVIARPHIAQILIKKGYSANVKDAFNSYLIKGRPAFVPKDEFHISDAIKMLKEAGGYSVIAHPGKYINFYHMQKFIELGINGIELNHPSNNDATKINLREFIDRHWLISTGGSDFHGIREEENNNLAKYCIEERYIAKIIEKNRKNNPIFFN